MPTFTLVRRPASVIGPSGSKSRRSAPDTSTSSRSQVWQWIRSPKGQLEDGRVIDEALFHEVLAEELEKVKAQFGDAGRYEEGAKLFGQITASEDFVDFLTLPAYEMID